MERGQPAFQLLLTNQELKIVEGMLGDLLDYAFSQRRGRNRPGAQMLLILALLQ